MRTGALIGLAVLGVGLPIAYAQSSGSLIQNGGFEGGTYNVSAYNYAADDVPDDWVVNGPFTYDPFASGVRGYPHTGAANLQMGPGFDSSGVVTNPETISQSFTDTPGDSYQVSFFLENTLGGNEASVDVFEAQINGVDGLDLNGLPAQAYRTYTMVTFGFTGTGTDTLTFAVSETQSDQTDWELDDVSVLTAPLTWNNAAGTGDGVHWDTTNQNWNNGAPANYIDGDNVLFNDANNGHYAVTLNGTVSPTSVTFNNSAGNYTLSGSGGIAGSGSLTLYGSGTVTISTANTYTGGTNVENGELIAASPSALPAGGTLAIGTTNTAAEVKLTASHGTLALSGLTIYSGSTLDLGSNGVLLSYVSGADPIGTIAGDLTAAYNAGWSSGPIFSSSVAAANASQTKLLYSIGYADGADGLTGVPSGTIAILPTLAGDAKLQGNVVFGDFQLLAQYFGQSGTSWDEGDFTYSGTTDFGDFQLLAQDFGSTTGSLTSGEIASLNSFAAQFGDRLIANSDGVGFEAVPIPEPAAAALAAMAGATLLVQRRRRGRGKCTTITSV